MRSLQQRIVVTLAATVTAAVCGTLVGFLLGRAITLRLAAGRLNREAPVILAEEEAGAAESRSVLAAMNASPFLRCSDAEIAYFRKLLYQSKYLKDAGRMSDGRMQCSATLSARELPQEQLQPDFIRRDGTKVYRNPAPFHINGLCVFAVELGGSYIVYNPYHEENLKAAFPPYLVTDTDTSSRRAAPLDGGLLSAPASILVQDGQAAFGNTMYATRCSRRFTSCITVYMADSEAFAANRVNFTGYILLGGLVGGLSGLLLSLFYRRSRSLEQQLRRAIRKDRLRMVYQPVVELTSGRIVGAEALARWTDEDGLVIGPAAFVRIAEQRGFVGEITQLALRHALHDLREELRGNLEFRLSVNVAAADLADPCFLPMLHRSLARESIAPQSVVIEITESSTANHQTAIQTILRLRALGHPVHIDDFGTGYSSLSYLHDLAVDAIKIDQSFTRAIGTEAVTVGILPQILAMAEALDLEVIVEGIETVEQAAYFAALSRPVLAQGWFYGRPVAAEEFKRRLAEEGIKMEAPADAA
jgi:sensor c-di-GMP phosphodiesterase-like protein